jgi:hypothetical protein
LVRGGIIGRPGGLSGVLVLRGAISTPVAQLPLNSRANRKGGTEKPHEFSRIPEFDAACEAN